MDGYWTFVLIFINLIASSKDCSGQETLNIYPFPTATVTEGASLTFTCTYSSNGYCPSSALYSWFLNGKQDLLLVWRNNSCIYGDGNKALNYTCGIAQSMCELTLTLAKVQRSQHGDVWQCRIGTMQINSTIFVNVPITSVDVTSPITSPVTVSENVPSTFVCETSAGRPQATIKWYKQLGTDASVLLQGGTISTIPSGTLVITRSTLYFTPTRSNHDYIVYCTAYSIGVSFLYTSSNQPQLYLQYAPDTGPVIQGRTSGSTFYIMDGKQQSLTCLIDGGRPLASLSLTCFSGAVQDQSTEITSKQQVTWTAARTHDGQRCRCQAYHPVWTSPRPVYVTVEALYPPTSPTFTVQSQSVTSTVSVIEGNSVSVTCSSTSNPSSVYAWNPSGSSPNIDILTLISVSTSNNGVYNCSVTNTMTPTQGDSERGSSSALISLNVLYPPTILHLTNDTAVENKTFSKYCLVIPGNPDTTEIRWIRVKDNTVFNSQTLTIANVTRGSAGTYRCTVYNIMQPTGETAVDGTDSATFILDVYYSASITEFTINGATEDGPFVYNENTTVTITCVVDSNPGSDITLSKDSSEMVTVTHRRYTTYIIEEASCLDAGMYSCTARNQYNGNSYQTISRHVYFICPPRPLDSMNNNTYYFALNENATITLTVTAYPEPTYRWYKQDIEITSGATIINSDASSNVHQTNLTLEQITQADLGQYKVVVTNSQGTLEHLLFVAVQEMAPARNGESESSASVIAGAVGGSAIALIVIGIVLLGVRRYKCSKGLSRCLLSESGTDQDQRDETNSHHVYVNTTASQDTMGSKDKDDRNMYEDLNMSHLQPQLYEQLQQGEGVTCDQDADKRGAYETLDHGSVKSQLYDSLQQPSDHLTETPKVYENLRLS